MVEHKFQSILETARANVVENASVFSAKPVLLNEKIEWLKGWVHGYFAAMGLDHEGKENRRAMEEFNAFADKHKHKVSLPL